MGDRVVVMGARLVTEGNEVASTVAELKGWVCYLDLGQHIEGLCADFIMRLLYSYNVHVPFVGSKSKLSCSR